MKPAQAFIAEGEVRHARTRPHVHAFAYPTFFLWLPMRALSQASQWGLSVNRLGWLSFHDQDHGDGRDASQGGALAWLTSLLHEHGIDDATGDIWLHCYPRVLGYAFKPVSFWHCHAADGQLRAIVVEVNNTFGERHCYLLDRPRMGQTLMADKHFHVSPFCEVKGHYRFRFMRSHDKLPERLVVRIEHGDDQGPLLITSVSGALEPMTPASVRRMMWRFPLLSLGVIARIHWQALKLWLKHVPFFSKPEPPANTITVAVPEDKPTLSTTPSMRRSA
ncbi:MAG: hypothetical protein RL111_1950 [Pseudomonadota bacterium]|jgi:DUF1365 family protein